MNACWLYHNEVLEDLDLMKYVSKHDFSFVPKIRQGEAKKNGEAVVGRGRPGRTGEARKDEVSLLPLGLHYPYRYSIVTTRTFPIGIRFTSRTKISYYTIIV